MNSSDEVIIRPFQRVMVEDADGKKLEVAALIDTGARMSSIDVELAVKLGIYDEDKLLYEKSFSSALGKQQRPVVAITFYLAGKKIETKANVANRSTRKQPILIGRRNLSGYLVRVTKDDVTYRKNEEV